MMGSTRGTVFARRSSTWHTNTTRPLHDGLNTSVLHLAGAMATETQPNYSAFNQACIAHTEFCNGQLNLFEMQKKYYAKACILADAELTAKGLPLN